MSEVSRKEAIQELNDLLMYVEHAFTKEHKKSTMDAITKAICDMQKIEELEKENAELKEKIKKLESDLSWSRDYNQMGRW